MPLVCVSSPKGGVGKTTLAANLSAQLARSGRDVIVLDLDPQNSLGLHFGMALDRRDGFMNSLRLGAERRPWRETQLRGPHGLHYLPYGHTDMDSANTLLLALTVEPTLLTDPLRDMLDGSALVVIDAPPGPSLAMPVVLPLVDLLLVVLLVDATSIAQIPAIESGRAYGLRGAPVDPERIGFVLNQLDLRTRLGRATVEAASRHLGDRLIGVIYRDENVAEAIASQKLIDAHAVNSKAAQDIAALAAAVGLRLPQAALA
jgi:cellulose synthase operon protein YhjQ